MDDVKNGRAYHADSVDDMFNQILFAPLTTGLGAMRRAAMLLLVMLLSATTAWATDKLLSGNGSYTTQDGDVLTGSTSGTVTIEANASITLSGATITDVTGTDAHGTIGFYSDVDCSTAISAAEEGTTVYIKVTPDTGYQLNSITTQKTVPSNVGESRRSTPDAVEIALGGEVEVKAVDAENGIYRLTMPSSNVQVKATFTPILYTEATVQVVWNDNNDSDHLRPESLVVTLSDGQEVTLSNGNSWGATVASLPAFDADNARISYTWTTTTDVTGYELEIASDDAVTILIYSHTPTPAHDFTFATDQTRMTWCSSEKYALPTGLEAYTVSGLSEDGTKVVLTPATAILADTPLLLKGTAGTTYTATYLSSGSATDIVSSETTDDGLTFYGNPTDSKLTFDMLFPVGTANATQQSYVLYKGAFTLVDANSGISGHRCWLNVATSNGLSRLGISIEGATGIAATTGLSPKSEGSWYDLQGRKLSGEPTKHGIYIFNGEKVRR